MTKDELFAIIQTEFSTLFSPAVSNSLSEFIDVVAKEQAGRSIQFFQQSTEPTGGVYYPGDIWLQP